ncbi:hypothetical protein DAI22_09g127750 [Oryza sativa Japonica Group]|nr:hypothetical protein DAI22_09g127750 [Oryza sativa Japonica Group]
MSSTKASATKPPLRRYQPASFPGELHDRSRRLRRIPAHGPLPRFASSAARRCPAAQKAKTIQKIRCKESRTSMSMCGCLLLGLCVGAVNAWVMVYFFLFPGYDPSGL